MATSPLAAAGTGQGVALTDNALAAADLAEGRLVRLFTTEITTDKAYWLVYPPASARRPKVTVVPGLAVGRGRRQRTTDAVPDTGVAPYQVER